MRSYTVEDGTRFRKVAFASPQPINTNPTPSLALKKSPTTMQTLLNMFSTVLKTTTTDKAASEKPVEAVEPEPKASLDALASSAPL